jgi:hypothetical protein
MEDNQYKGPPTHRPKVTCLCATKGRFEFLSKAVAYYDNQSYKDKELIIFNNHKVPITLSEELSGRSDIKLINAGEFDSIVDVYNSAITFCNGEYTAIWDDDDMYFPWHLTQGIKRLEETGGDAYKPEIQLMWMHDKDRVDTVKPVCNSCEGSNIISTNLLKSSGFGNPGDLKAPQHPHPKWQQDVKKWVYGNTILEGAADPTYVYVWNGSLHVNGHLSQGFEYYARNNTDTGEGEILTTTDVWVDYTRVFELLDEKSTESFQGTKKFTEKEKDTLRAKFELYGTLKDTLPELKVKEWKPVPEEATPVDFDDNASNVPVIEDFSKHTGMFPDGPTASQTIRCCTSILHLDGGTAEVGVYKGGSSKLVMETFAKAGQSNIHIGIDPYGNMSFWDYEWNQHRIEDNANYPGYTNRLGYYTQSLLFNFAHENKQDYLYFKLTDSDFYKIFADGVPIYKEEPSMLNSYRLVLIDGNHKTSCVLEAIHYFDQKMVKDGIIIFDDVNRYPHKDLVHPVLISLGYTEEDTTNDRIAYKCNKLN